MVSKITTPISDLDEVDKINELIDEKQDVLTAGDNITIANNVISAKDTVYTAGTDIEIVKGSGGILPQGYQELKYIESTGTQYIDTEVVPTLNTKLVVKTTRINVGGFAGSRDGADANSTMMSFGTNGTSVIVDFNNSQNTPYRVNYNAGAGTVTVIAETSKDARKLYDENGTLLAENTTVCSDTFTATKNMYLFSCNGASISNGCRIYYAQIYDNNTLVRDFVPAKRNSDNKLGMYDLVNNQFYANTGTGTFIAGPSTTLPTGYTQLTYLESQVSPTLAYIDTDINFNSSYTYELKYSKGGNANAVMGARVGAYNAKGNFAVTYVTQSAVYSSTSTSSTAVDFGDTTLGIIHDIKYNQSQSLLTFDGVDYWKSGWINEVSIPYNIYLFAMNQANSVQGSRSSYARIYSYRVTGSNRVVQNLIPAKRNSDSVLGMYDTVNDVFYTNAGTGSFIAGEVVGDELIINFTNKSGYALSSEIPTVNNSTISFTQGGVSKGSFTLNQSTGATIALDAGGGSNVKTFTATCPALTPSSGICSWSVTHNLGSQDVVTALYNGSNKVSHNTNIVSQNELTISFLSATNVSAGDYKVVVIAL